MLSIERIIVAIFYPVHNHRWIPIYNTPA